MPNDQPMPTPGSASVANQVIHDLEERRKVGTERYGTELQTHNGRDSLRDAYEGALDLSCYLRQAIMEGRTRGERQVHIYNWVFETFGPLNAGLEERAARFFEEAAELAQACDVSRAKIDRILDVVYSRPPGAIAQEIGGVSITLLALAEAAGVDAEKAEASESARVLAKPPSHWRQRHQQKADQGIALPPGQ